MTPRICLISVFLCSCPCVVFGTTTTADQKILDNISKNHNRLVGPYAWNRTYVNMTLTFIPRGVVKFDEVAGQISVALAIDVRWLDKSLAWDVSKYGNVTLILPESEIWTPLIALANPVERLLLFPEEEFNVRVYPSGLAVLIKGGAVSTTCKPFVKYYPFDVHTCSVKMFPMGHTLREIRFLTQLYMNVFNNFGQWNLFIASVQSEILDVFSLASFDFYIKRRPEFSMLSLCIPIIMLGVLNSCVFLIPPESGERISYAITVLLLYSVFMTIISDNMPSNSDPVPVLIYVLLIMMAESGIIVILTIYGLRLHFRTDHRPIPRLLRLTMKLFRRVSTPVNADEISKDDVKDEESEENDKFCDMSWRRIAAIYDTVFLCISFVVLSGTVIYYVIAVNIH
ncbi:hypothetical protein FSP39_015738 [Pinctada imbricata]|uniref:Uncharacterized protein n=1 Tax=Pinctada imbricata TaxID=66713 RepID=A0AA88XEN7_PINIB|nr:hypothetical protein FSP39_015738 [Pinctada imbricata]